MIIISQWVCEYPVQYTVKSEILWKTFSLVRVGWNLEWFTCFFFTHYHVWGPIKSMARWNSSSVTNGVLEAVYAWHHLRWAHCMFWNFNTQMNISTKEYPILHQHDLSFHLSHQLPLYLIVVWLFTTWVSIISTNSCSKTSSTTYRGGWWLKWKLRSCWWWIGYSFGEIFICVLKFQNMQCGLQAFQRDFQ